MREGSADDRPPASRGLMREAGSARPRHRVCRGTARAATQSRAETLSSGQCGAWPHCRYRPYSAACGCRADAPSREGTRSGGAAATVAARKPVRERRRARTRKAGDWGERSRTGGSGAPTSGGSADSLIVGWALVSAARARVCRMGGKWGALLHSRPRRLSVQRHICEISLNPNPMIQMFQL